jgi:hypothetical protein
MKQKLKQILKTKTSIIVLSIILAVGIIQIGNLTIKTYKEIASFISNPIPAYAISEVEIPLKDYKYNEKVPIEIIKQEIKKQAREFELDEKFMLDLAFCESSYNNLADNPKSTAKGLYQFVALTWEATESNKNKISEFDYKANITEAMKAIKRGEEWRWSECLN